MKKKTIVLLTTLVLLGLAMNPILAFAKDRGWWDYQYGNITVDEHSSDEKSHHYYEGSITGDAYATSVYPSYATEWTLTYNYCPEPTGGVVHVRVSNNEDYQITVYYTVRFYVN